MIILIILTEKIEMNRSNVIMEAQQNKIIYLTFYVKKKIKYQDLYIDDRRKIFFLVVMQVSDLYRYPSKSTLNLFSHCRFFFSK